MSVAPVLQAQVKVENPQALPFSRDEMMLGYRIARDEVREAMFSDRRVTLLESAITLRLGCDDPATGEEYFDTHDVRVGHGFRRTAVICMRQWDVGKFMFGVMRITERWVIPVDRYDPLLEDALRRVNRLAPVTATDLKKDELKKKQVNLAPESR